MLPACSTPAPSALPPAMPPATGGSSSWPGEQAVGQVWHDLVLPWAVWQGLDFAVQFDAARDHPMAVDRLDGSGLSRCGHSEYFEYGDGVSAGQT
ncbi:hypothetical protein P6B95_02130 [Streptomyces atratus]|uniref:hypothetical protein n=1 Tax=Streptomyces atratus TaxID=1893 RepID=UPI0016715DBC|nr:hypothetical protein [Streptomyces atratus]WPW26368.1 hypothetical protein P6B95_02130 [Streptomyces atratus]